MNVLCINDTFTELQQSLIPNRPVKDRIYTIRDVIRTLGGAVGLLLEEIKNPPLEHPSGLGTFEPNFDIKRFRDINGDILNLAEILADVKYGVAV